MSSKLTSETSAQKPHHPHERVDGATSTAFKVQAQSERKADKAKGNAQEMVDWK
jgi:hypothetical protein